MSVGEATKTTSSGHFPLTSFRPFPFLPPRQLSCFSRVHSPSATRSPLCEAGGAEEPWLLQRGRERNTEESQVGIETNEGGIELNERDLQNTSGRRPREGNETKRLGRD
jgi:hypothetical protein